jgi:SWI/SNF-related matrix-associated actin-dependent regulator 1 of chromatin subfamily A
LFIDEAHRFKNDTAGRTKVIFGDKKKEGIAKWFDRVYYLSGTPMPNRPMELYPVLSNSAPETIDFMDRFKYGIKYCAGHKNEFGWDFSGASDVTELASKVIGKFMIRMRKDEVLKELPPKTEELVLIGDNLTPKLAEIDSKILKTFSPQDLMNGRLGDGEELHLMTYRKELGIHKAPLAGKYIESLLEDTDENILVFAIHKDVIYHLQTCLEKYNPLVITGDTAMKVRHDVVQRFQDASGGHRLFIGNIQAAGTGLTLTKASRVVFAEFSWVPADNDQASDRAHRIGQRDNVFVQYLVFQNSIDRTVIETILRKKKVTNKLV